MRKLFASRFLLFSMPMRWQMVSARSVFKKGPVVPSSLQRSALGLETLWVEMHMSK